MSFGLSITKITTCKSTYRTRKLGSPVKASAERVRKKLEFSLLEQKRREPNKS